MLGGTLTGDGLEAKITPGGDYAIVKDGWGKLDVRVHAVTSDDEVIYIQYYGQLEVTPAVGKSKLSQRLFHSVRYTHLQSLFSLASQSWVATQQPGRPTSTTDTSW